MSKFLTKLKCEINNTLRYDYDGDVIGSVDKPIKLIDSLGENARRLLEIGIVQDRLAELGLSTQGVSRSLLFFDNPKPIKNGWMGGVEVYFNENAALCVTNREIFEYTSLTWQDDLINKVKELIDAK